MRTRAFFGRNACGTLATSMFLLIACSGGDNEVVVDGGSTGGGGMTGTGGMGVPSGTGGSGVDAASAVDAAATVPSSCSGPTDCPAGYVCVPPPGSTTTVVDSACLAMCTPGCDLAGPVKAMCLETCNQACMRVVPADGGASMGTCHRDNSGGGGGGGGGLGGMGGSAGMGGSGGNTGVAIQWAGTWSADVSHTSDCKWGGTAMQTGDQKYTVTMKVAGTNAAPTATITGGFELEGTGGDDRMTLTGDFPFRSWKGEAGKPHNVNAPNQATIKITSVESANKASGTIEGSWDASAGWKCTAKNGTIQLTR